MSIPGRKYDNGSGYRYGFNGKEDDKDISEGGQDYGARIYDGRLGRFLSIDPLTKNYPMLTPYQFASNSPICLIDIVGLEGGKPVLVGTTWPRTMHLTATQVTANINSLNVTGIPISYLKDLLLDFLLIF